MSDLVKCGFDKPPLYVYDFSAKSADRPRAGVIPWYLEFIFTSFSKKHVLELSRNNFNILYNIAFGLEQWKRKRLWEFFHSSKVEDSPNSAHHFNLKSKGRITPACNFPVPRCVSNYIEESVQVAWDSISRVVAKNRGSFFSPRIIQFALSEFRKSDWSIFASDKDGGFVLMPSKHKHTMFEQSLVRPAYSRIHSELDTGSMHSRYREVVSQLASLVNDRGFAASLNADLYKHTCTVTCNIDATIKTHKPIGEVVPRLLHTSPAHAWAPGMRYIARILRLALRNQSHILRDTKHLLASLSCIQVEPADRLIKIDVKDFFMSGRHAALAQDCYELVLEGKFADYFGLECSNSEYAHSFRSLVEVVLQNQVVIQDRRSFAVRVGSGMGMISSGDISDSSLYNKLEKCFMLSQQVRNEYHIKYYGRFKDDIFMVSGSSMDKLQTLFRCMKERAGFFKLKVDECSKSSVVMLDVCLAKSSSEFAAPLASSLHVKATSNWRPLSSESMHHPSIHRAWPASQLRRIKSLCSTPSSQRSHLLHFFAKLKDAGCMIPCTEKQKPSHSKLLGTAQRYLILPYTYAVEGLALNRGLERVRAKWHFRSLKAGFALPATSIGWRLGGTHLVNILKNKDKKNGRMVGDG